MSTELTILIINAIKVRTNKQLTLKNEVTV